LAVLSSKDDEGSATNGQPASAQGSRPRSGQREPVGRDGHVGAALRSAYDEAVREQIPDEFIALLGKLS